MSLPTGAAAASSTTVAESLASGYMPVVRSAVVVPRGPATSSAAFSVVYPRGPISGLPEEHASRRERFEELDALQVGWTLELRQRAEGGVVDAVFFGPDGEEVGLYAAARRKAMLGRVD